jgi:hypothetical protein
VKTAVITCFFNPQQYRSRLENFAIFARAMRRRRIPVFAVEALFAGEAGTIGKFADTLIVSCEAVLWQKESLLNLLLRQLDERYEAVVWCDADVLFENPDWFKILKRELKKYAVVQPFSEALRLPRGARRAVKSAERFESFGSVYVKKPQLLLKGDFAAHGHTGFAWAARREVLAEHGLYDAMIAGSGDHVMAHAFAGDFSSRCIRRIMADNEPHIRHFVRWAEQIYPRVRGRVGFVPGRLLHLWHGETEHRRYVDRNRELAAFGFNPEKHLERDARGLWRWRTGKSGLRGSIERLTGGSRQRQMQDWAIRYFESRREDG